MNLDADFVWAVVRTTIPIALAARQWSAERRAHARARLPRATPDAAIIGGALEPGAKVTLRVRPFEASAPTNLGFSTETDETISGAPTLRSVRARFATSDGRIVDIEEGQSLTIRDVPGALRTPGIVVTTAAGGVKRDFSFELPAGMEVALEGMVPKIAPSGGASEASATPFRNGTLVLEAPYVVSAPESAAAGQFSGVGIISYPVAAAGIAALFWAESVLTISLALMVWLASIFFLGIGASIANDFRKDAGGSR